jgi:hypothetical protein
MWSPRTLPAPLHRTVRRRRKNALLEDGALALATNNAGSTPMPLAAQNTGHSGASAPQAKVQQPRYCAF